MLKFRAGDSAAKGMADQIDEIVESYGGQHVSPDEFRNMVHRYERNPVSRDLDPYVFLDNDMKHALQFCSYSMASAISAILLQ
ncbi:MAG TPA: hypothetical protein VLC28_04100 [Flavitalea sp.]|nr:hypothetical protein [Flavitalea sp.]